MLLIKDAVNNINKNEYLDVLSYIAKNIWHTDDFRRIAFACLFARAALISCRKTERTELLFNNVTHCLLFIRFSLLLALNNIQINTISKSSHVDNDIGLICNFTIASNDVVRYIMHSYHPGTVRHIIKTEAKRLENTRYFDAVICNVIDSILQKLSKQLYDVISNGRNNYESIDFIVRLTEEALLALAYSLELKRWPKLAVIAGPKRSQPRLKVQGFNSKNKPFSQRIDLKARTEKKKESSFVIPEN